MFRTYLNRFGRFNRPDPLAGSLGNPQSLNRYPYVAGDPVNFVDHLGLCGDPHEVWRDGDMYRLWCAEAASGGGGGAECVLDGILVPCSLANNSASVACPNNACTAVNVDGRPVYFAATLTGSGYYAYTGPGARFYSREAAAIAAGLSILPKSGQNYEQGMALYKDAAGFWSYNSPAQGSPCQSFDLGSAQCGVDIPLHVPEGSTLGGTVHSHPFGSPQSDQDRINSRTLGLPDFIVTPDGAITMYDPRLPFPDNEKIIWPKFP